MRHDLNSAIGVGRSRTAKDFSISLKELVMCKSLLIGAAFFAVVGLSLISGRSGEALAAQDAKDEKIAASKIVKVVVYPNSALVTREVDAPVGAGLTELVVSPLPPQAISSSLYSEGTDGLRVLSTRFRIRQIFQDSREDVRKAEAERTKLEQAIEKLHSEIKAVTDNMALLTKTGPGSGKGGG
jgi:hypothetical protein